MLNTKFKVCIFGDAGVGKTTLVNRYLTGLFDTNFKITIGADFYLKKLKIDDSEVTLQIWDFAGEDQYQHSWMKKNLKQKNRFKNSPFPQQSL